MYLFIYGLYWIFIATQAFLHGLFSSCNEWGLLFVLVHRLLIASHCGTWALGHRALELQLLDSRVQAQQLWDLPRPEIQLESPAVAGRFFATEPPGRHLTNLY